MATLDDFFTALCTRMGWEATPWRLNVLKTMAQMEGTYLQAWNPLDTMHPAGASGNWNSAGVKIYPNQAAGVEATARTLEQSNFTNLRQTLQSQQVNAGTAGDLATWGWSDPNLQNTILSAMGGTGVAAAGAGTMTNGTVTGQPTTGTVTGTPTAQPGASEAQARIEKILEQAYALLDTPPTDENYAYNIMQGNALLSNAVGLAKVYGVGTAEMGEPAPQYVTAPSPQEQAISLTNMETALAQVDVDIKKFGVEVAAQNFANKIAALQEGRSTAEFAQQYERNLAPPGMTTLPYTGPDSAAATYAAARGIPYEAKAAIPLTPSTLPSDPYAALAQGMAAGPQPTEIPFNPPTLPTTAGVAGLSAFEQVAPSGAYNTASLPTDGGQNVKLTAEALLEAMKRFWSRFQGVGSAGAGTNLPIYSP